MYVFIQFYLCFIRLKSGSHHEYDALANKLHNKQNDEKININIFLAQRITEIDMGSDSEGSGKTIKTPKMVILKS